MFTDVHSIRVFRCFLEPFHKSSYQSLLVPVQQYHDTPRVSVEGGAKRQVEPGGVAVYAQRIQPYSINQFTHELPQAEIETV